MLNKKMIVNKRMVIIMEKRIIMIKRRIIIKREKGQQIDDHGQKNEHDYDYEPEDNHWHDADDGDVLSNARINLMMIMSKNNL